MLSDAWIRLRSLFRRKAVEAELDDELRFHLDRQAEKYVRVGMTPEEARRRARIELGGLEQTKEQCRDARGIYTLESVLRDIRYAFRTFRKSPGLVAIVVLSLALGIGANTTIFSLMNAMMLDMLPVRSPGQLVLLNRTGTTPVTVSDNGSANAAPFSYPTFENIRAHSQAFSTVFGFVPLWKANVRIGGQASLARAELVTGNYFSGLGVKPTLGQAISAEDERAGAPPVAVISYRYWARQFGLNPGILGKAIAINGVLFTIAGVAPPGFYGLQPGRAVEIWLPLTDNPKLLPYGMSSAPGGRDLFTATDWWWLMIMGRLRRGVTMSQAAAQTELLFQQSIAGTLKTRPRIAPRIQLVRAAGGLANLRQHFSRTLWILMTVVTLVLLVACANVASLLLERSHTRQKEIALRLSLGAPRQRVVRQLLTESVLLAGIGGAVGLLLAYWGSHALLLLLSGGAQPLNLTVEPDGRVLAFTAGVSLLTGVLFGVAPALRSTRIALGPALKEGPGSAFAKGRQSWVGLGNFLVVAQVSLSMLLLVGAGLFVRTLENLRSQDFGFDQNHLLLFSVDASKAGYKGEALTDVYGRLLKRVEALPGVASASASEFALLSGAQNSWNVSIVGIKPKPGEDMGAEWSNVGPSFFQTMRIPLLLGRGVGWQDTANSPRVAAVNEAFARHFLDGRNPIGHVITFKNYFGKGRDFAYRIVGLVRDAKYASVREAPEPTVYCPFSQAPFNLWGLTYELRTAGNPVALVSSVRGVVHDIDPDLPVAGFRTQTEQIAERLAQERLFAELSSFFAGLAAFLACIGLYGLVAYSVSRRTHEIGIRVALGAQRTDVLRLVIFQGAKLVFIGLAAGIGGALALTRLIASQLYGVAPTDPYTFAGVAALLAIVALAACYVPARRAMRVDPVTALRDE